MIKINLRPEKSTERLKRLKSPTFWRPKKVFVLGESAPTPLRAKLKKFKVNVTAAQSQIHPMDESLRKGRLPLWVAGLWMYFAVWAASWLLG